MLRRIFKLLLSRKRHRKTQDKLYANLDIGPGTHIERGNLDSMFPQLIHIGTGCIFAPASIVLAHDASYVMFTGKYRVAPVHIGNRVFVGYGAVVMPGITIGDNVVIGALSIVVNDIPANSVAVGAPAKIICSIDEFLDRAKPEQLFQPDFDYAANNATTPEQVLQFRSKVYQEMYSLKKEKS